MAYGDTNACEIKFYPGDPPFFPGPGLNPLEIDPPDLETDACDDNFFLDWEDSGTPPYIFTVQTRGLSTLQAATFGNLSGGFPTFQVAFPSGTQIMFGVQDFEGNQDFGTLITVQKSEFAPSNSCVISNLTGPDHNVPVPTTTLPFPSFYPLLPEIRTAETTYTSETSTPTSIATHSLTSSTTPFRTAPNSGNDTGGSASSSKKLGLGLGITFGLIFLGAPLAFLLLLSRRRLRREVAEAYWVPKMAVDARVLGPRTERDTATETMTELAG